MNKLKSIVTDKRIMAAAVMALGVTVAVSTFASGGPKAGTASGGAYAVEVQTSVDGIPFKYTCTRTRLTRNYNQKVEAWNAQYRAWKNYPEQSRKWNKLSKKEQEKQPKLNPGNRRPPKPTNKPQREYWDNGTWVSGSQSTNEAGVWSGSIVNENDLSQYRDMKIKCTFTFSKAGSPANTNSAPYYILGGCTEVTPALHRNQPAAKVIATYDNNLKNANWMRAQSGCPNISPSFVAPQ